MSDTRVEVGSCDLCGQVMYRTAEDCWHPWNVTRACPPEPDSTGPEYSDWLAAGNRSLRPGREHFIPGFTCPRCGRTSHNPNDVKAGYCGACHDWTGTDLPLFGGIRVLVDPDLPANVIEVFGGTAVRIQLPDEPEEPG